MAVPTSPSTLSACRRVLARLLPAGALLLAGACDGDEPPPGPTELLWQIPDLPWPWTMEVGGRAVDEGVLREFLEGEWADYAAERGVTAEKALEALDGFCADPEARFGSLVGDALLLWEGERRFPVLDLTELQAYREEMEAATGAAMDALLLRLGEDGLQRFVENRFRLERTLDAIAGEIREPTEAELLEDYKQVVEAAELPEGAGSPTFQELEPRLRQAWRKRRWYDAGREWIAAARRGVAARVTRPDGRILDLPAP